MAVEAEYGAESRKLEPADEHFFELIGIDVAAVETADIGGPPRNTGQTHIQSGSQLIPQGPETGVDIPRPHQGPVFL